MPYIIKIAHGKDLKTLEWLADQGYDARFLELAIFQGTDLLGQYVFAMSEPNAALFREEIEDDPSAFRLLQGSHDTLNATLHQFLDSIV